MASNESMKQSIDGANSTQWAIASLDSVGGGEGGGVSATEFELVNLHTARAHRLALSAAGATLGLLPISLSTTTSNYAYFITPKPVNFMDFDGKGAVLGSVSLLLYSGSRLTIWDGSAYVAERLVDKLTIDGGWGFSTPGADVGWGVTELIFGDGRPSGDVELAAPDIDLPSKEPTDLRVTSVSHEKVEFDLAGDALFGFNRADIRADAEKDLQYAGIVVRSKPGRVQVNGYTDSIGDDAYNRDLSKRRAAVVAK